MYRRNSPNSFCSSNPTTNNSHSTFYHGAMWGGNEFHANSTVYENLNSPGVNNNSGQYSPSVGMMCQPPSINNYHINNHNNNNNHNSNNHLHQHHQLVYPHYNSLKINKNEKYLINQPLGESKTLGRYCNTNSYPKSLTNSFANINLASDDKNNFKSEHCLNWLENTENIDSIENHMKELDTNIKLLTWKMKHLENLKLQKNTMTKQIDASDSHQSDSPPPLSDFLKPELSIMSTDDGFESVADAGNNASRLQISNLESQLRKQELTMKMYEAMLNKSKQQVNLMKSQFKNKENQYQEEIEKLKHGYDFDYMYNSLPRIIQKSQAHQKRQVQQNVSCDSTANTMQKKCSISDKPVSKSNEQREQIAVTPNSVTPNKPVRPNSLSRKQLFYSDSHKQQQDTAVSTPQQNKMSMNDNSLHANESYSGSKSAGEKNDTNSSEVLKLKSELLIKDQHLRKMRTALRELSVRHNELLDLHMQLIKNDKTSSSLSTSSYLLSPSSLASPIFSSPSSLAGTPADKNSFVHDLTCIVENLQKVIGHVSTAPHKFTDLCPAVDGSSDFLSPSQCKSNELAKLKIVVQNLKLDVLKRCYSKD